MMPITVKIRSMNKVQELLPRLSQTRVNFIKYQGKSAVDAAADNGHNNVVQYLRDYDCFRRPLTDPIKERGEQSMNFLIQKLLNSDGRYIEHDLNNCINFQPNLNCLLFCGLTRVVI
jgi:hypothetical protein